jgi:hypothetical protein
MGSDLFVVVVGVGAVLGEPAHAVRRTAATTNEPSAAKHGDRRTASFRQLMAGGSASAHNAGTTIRRR